MNNFYLFLSNFLPDEMMFNCKMFGSIMEHKVLWKFNYNLIITQQFCGFIIIHVLYFN